MKNRFIHILICLLAGSFVPLWGQEELSDEFDRFVQEQNKTFDEHTRKMNMEFADFLEKEWSRFETFSRQPKRHKPDKPVVKQNENQTFKIQLVPEEIQDAIRKPNPSTLPKQGNDQMPDVRIQKKILFFGMNLSVPFSTSFIIPLNDIKEHAVAKAWRLAANRNYAELISALRYYKKELCLNDFGYMQLIQKTTEAFCSGTTGCNSSVFLAAFLLNQEGYSARLGRTEHQLVLLSELNETVYGILQMKEGNHAFSMLTIPLQDAPKELYTYRESFPTANRLISMSLPELPRLKGEILESRLPHTWKEKEVTVFANKALIDFFGSIPQTDFPVYTQSRTSDEMKKLCHYLRPFLESKSETEAVGILLDFVQNTFDYQTDIRQFGHEKVFFPEEMLYYPYNDCEDRAIFFCRLVQELLSLPIVLVNYPNHVAAAVRFGAEVTGAYYQIEGEKFILCDPTYINAGIGECMPEFKQTKAKIIKL